MNRDAKHRTLLAGISHQFGQPLTVLRGTLEMALMGECDHVDCRAAMEHAMKEADRLISLAGLLRELAAVESLSGVNTVVDMEAQVREVLRDMGPMAEAQGVRLEAELAPEVRVRGEAQQLRQILTNLVDCMVSFASPGSFVNVALREAGGESCVRIHAEDSTLTRSRLEEMLQPFTGRQPRPPEGDGSLGMAICHHAVDVLGGRVELESDDDRVVAISICFPAAAS